MKKTENTDAKPDAATGTPYWSPYVAGLGLGLTLLASYWLLGAGLGASSALARLSAWGEHAVVPRHVEATAYFGEWFRNGSAHVLRYYLVFMVAGTLIGGFLSALGSGRIRPSVERGPRISARGRLLFALAGGVLVGFASRLSRGCTSGQALSGTALLLSGSVVFLISLFVAAYVAGIFVRREWL